MNKLKWWLSTSIAPIIWGSTYFITQNWLPEDKPFTATVLRAIPAGLLLLLWTRQHLPKKWVFKVFILSALNVSVFFSSLFTAAYLLPSSVAALLLASQPIWVVIFSYFCLSKTVSRSALFQCLLGVSGVGFLLSPENFSLNILGIVVALLGAASMSMGMLMTKYWERPKDLSMAGLTGWQLLVGGLGMLPVMLWTEGMPNSIEAPHLLGYGYLAVFGGVIAYSLWFHGIQKLETFSVSILGFLSPLTATLIGFTIQGESFSLLQWLGVMLIVGAMLFSVMVTIYFHLRVYLYGIAHKQKE